MENSRWKDLDQLVAEEIAKLANRGFRGIYVLGDGWQPATAVPCGSEGPLPEGGWAVVVGDAPAAAYVTACRELGLVGRDVRKVLHVGPVMGSGELAEALEAAGVVVAYRSFLLEVQVDLLGEACSWETIWRPGRQNQVLVREMEHGWEHAAGIFPEAGEEGELAVVSELAGRLAPSRQRSSRRGGCDRLPDVLARMYSGGGSPRSPRG